MQMQTNEEIFFKVFSEARFPYFSADIKKIALVIKDQIPHSQLSIPTTLNRQKKDIVSACFRGLIRNTKPPVDILKVFAESEILKPILQRDNSLLSKLDWNSKFYSLNDTKTTLEWEIDNFGPLAYSTFFAQFLNLVELYYRLITMKLDEGKKRKIEIPILSEHPRFMPTAIHYAAASLGVWLTGSMNFPYFSYYATMPQIQKRDTNINYALRIGYDNKSAVELADSGIVSLPASLMLPLMQAQGQNKNGSMIFGTLPIDEFNIANWPEKKELNKTKDEIINGKIKGFILDKYYRTPFHGRELNNCALYGANSVLRDHYTDFYNFLGTQPLVRCKHYCAPIIDVADVSQIKTIVAKIPIRNENGIFFRGQTKLYLE